METIGKRIRKERARMGASQKELGNILGYSSATVRAWEADRNQPKLCSINDLCDVFKCTSDYLLGRTENRT